MVHGSCGSAGALKRALRCYHDMQQRGVPPDTQTVNSLINAFAKVGDVECAFRVAASMEHKQLAPQTPSHGGSSRSHRHTDG